MMSNHRGCKPQAVRNLRPSQSGLTLIELMVSMVIGLLLLLAVVSVFLSTQQTHRINDNIGRMQENARIALELMSRDIRSAGATSCLRIPQDELAELFGGERRTASLNVIASPPIPGGLALGVDIRGFDAGNYVFIGGAADARIVPTADGFHIGRLGDCDAGLESNMTARNAEIRLEAAAQRCGFATGQLLVINDCTNMDVFRPSNVNLGAVTVIQHGGAQNTSANLSKAYDRTARVAGHRAVGYYLALVAPPAGPARRSLVLDQGQGALNPVLVEDIEDMQILYGEDTNGDLAADVFVAATNVSDWSAVVAARINLLLSSEPGIILFDGNQAYDWFGDLAVVPAQVVAPDRRAYRTFSQTVTIRNRLP